MSPLKDFDIYKWIIQFREIVFIFVTFYYRKIWF